VHKKCSAAGVAWILVIIGAINWGLYGLGMLLGSNWNVVERLFSRWSTVEAIVYILVGLSAIYSLTGCRCKSCSIK